MEEKHNRPKSESDLKNIAVIIGLGNPGDEYEHTYHNVGFLAVDHLTDGSELSSAKSKNYAAAKIGGKIFMKPTTFMNRSGIAVAELLNYYKLKPEQILVIHDDADIPVGELKLQFGRGAAGHHGVESIVEQCGTNDFWRARIGIEQRIPITHERIPAERYVLKPISKTHLLLFEDAFSRIRAALGI